MEMAIIARPRFQLRSLPLRMRWEVTRRHPYYQIYWKLARDLHDDPTPAHPEDLLWRQAAALVLGQIGVSGKPPDPATDFKHLSEDELQSAWLSGAVQPITMRGIAGVLMAALPKSSLCALSALMFEASKPDGTDKPPTLATALQQLGRIELEGIDCFLDEPVVSINPAASAREIRKGLDQAIVKWKRERGLSERRNRSEKFDSYLRVWDKREGWTGAVYDRDKERTLREVARGLRQSITTVRNHYCRAFELIVGYPYSPEAWGTFFGVLKLTRLIQQRVSGVSSRRPQRSKTRRDVPESRLLGSPNNEEARGPISFASTYSDQHVHEILLDVESLIEQGKTPREIAMELEIPVELIPDIESFLKLVDPEAKAPRKK